MTRRGAILLAIIAVLVLVQLEPASGHSWYPSECCSGEDCRPVEMGEVTEDGAWYVYRGVRFRKDQTKQSPDKDYHICLVPSKGFGGQPFIRCMWRPFSGA